jgi:hypothetical protein
MLAASQANLRAWQTMPKCDVLVHLLNMAAALAANRTRGWRSEDKSDSIARD